MIPGEFPFLEYLKSTISGPALPKPSGFIYPTAISKTLQFQILEVEKQRAILGADADPELHGNQQGTIHGGFICELADAAIGTAHSTIMTGNQSFTTIELKVNFIRPSWKTRLKANAYPIYSGRSITHYKCDITNDDDKMVAFVVSTVMTLNGEKAKGR